MVNQLWIIDGILAQADLPGEAQAEGIPWNYILAGLGALVGLLCAFFFIKFGSLWLQAKASGCPVSLVQFVGMFLRKIPPGLIVGNLVMSFKAGVPVSLDKLQAHYLADGRLTPTVKALVAADRANIDLTFERAAAIDLAGRDVFDAVKTSVLPKVIDCPSPESGKPTVDAVAMNGIQLRCKARVTVRTNIDRLVGGATEETVVARVGEGIVSGIGQAASHNEVLSNPRKISEEVLNAGLDSGTAYEIVSIDIADIDVGANIGAKLKHEQAEADKQMAVANAEAQAAKARARGEEMETLGKEMKAKVILAEAEIPKAIAAAFTSGNLGVMDYYSLKNLQADTDMRSSLSGENEEEETTKKEEDEDKEGRGRR